MAEKAEEKTQEQKDYEAIVGRANKVLTEEGVDVAAQLVIVMADGSHVPIQGIIAKPIVVEQKNGHEQTKPDAGASKNDEPVPAKTK